MYVCIYVYIYLYRYLYGGDVKGGRKGDDRVHGQPGGQQRRQDAPVYEIKAEESPGSERVRVGFLLESHPTVLIIPGGGVEGCELNAKDAGGRLKRTLSICIYIYTSLYIHVCIFVYMYACIYMCPHLVELGLTRSDNTTGGGNIVRTQETS